MSLTKYEKAKEVISKHKGTIMNVNDLKRMIIKDLGGDERTIIGYLMVMRETGLIEEVEHLRFKING